MKEFVKRFWIEILLITAMLVGIASDAYVFALEPEEVVHPILWILAFASLFAGLIYFATASSVEAFSITGASMFLITVEISFILLYARAFRVLGLLKGNNVTHNSIDCIYFSAITWSTVGYGDVVPSDDARLWAASEALLSYFGLALFVASFARIFGKRRLSVN
jgi:uncharacterized protein involved in response to NO